MKIKRHRDLTLIYTDSEILTVACDSLGGIGELEYDEMKADGYTVGYHTAFVALAETLSVGAKPILITDSLSVALDSYGKSILSGIKAAAEESGMDTKGSITGSSEENFKSASTGIGVTIIGRLPHDWTPPKTEEFKYEAVVMGLPFVGEEVIENKGLILSLEAVKAAAASPDLIDMIPAGSKGLLYEANQLAASLGMTFREKNENPDMIRKSAGPATCAVAAIKPGAIGKLKKITGKTVTLIGAFVK